MLLMQAVEIRLVMSSQLLSNSITRKSEADNASFFV